MGYCRKCGKELTEDARYCPRCGTAVAVEEKPEPVVHVDISRVEPGLKLATWGERFVAWLIDIAIIDFSLFTIGLVLFVGRPFSLLNDGGWWSAVFNFRLSGLVFFLYWALMDGVYGRSIGKMVMRLRVTKLNGSQPTFGQAALESVGKAFILPLDVLIGWGLFPKRKQRVFNQLSATIVVRD
ncbi:MAG: RDD family protein [Candidatus Bathyarchaeia archaeon]